MLKFVMGTFRYLRELFCTCLWVHFLGIFSRISQKESEKGQKIVLTCSITCIAGQSGSENEQYARTGFSVAVTVTEMIFITLTVLQLLHKERQMKKKKNKKQKDKSRQDHKQRRRSYKILPEKQEPAVADAY